MAAPQKPYEFPDLTPDDFIARLPEITAAYREYGVVLLPGMLNHDPNYRHYVAELERVFDELLARKLEMDGQGLELGEKLTKLAAAEPMLGKIIATLGTQHNKFFSFNKVKYADYLQRFLLSIWGGDALITTPQAGDTLHFFPPGKNFHRYNLPAHQDYPYLMQSPRQVTMYFGLSTFAQGVGGLRIWEKSHELGVMACVKTETGAYEVHDWEQRLADYAQRDYSWNPGDFGIFDSLLAHSSIPNTTSDHSRIVQIFRYSDLNDDVARGYDFGSAVYPRDGLVYEQEHPDLFIKTPS